MYVFPSPQHLDRLALVMNVFPFCGLTALFSDAVEYRFRLRPARIATTSAGAAFALGDEEFTVTCRFAAPVEPAQGGQLVQQGTCATSRGQTVSFRVNDEAGGHANGLTVFAGCRLDPFFFDSAKTLMTLMTGKLSFDEVGSFLTFRQNVLSIVVEIENSALTAGRRGPLFAVVSETVRPGPISIRLERVGRPEIKNLLLIPKQYDKVNRDVDLRDLYNQEDAFNLARTYLSAFRSRINGTLTFLDGLDGKTDWPLDERGTHPLTELLLRDFMVVDVSKPFSEDSTLEVERATAKGVEHDTCGGRWLNDDSVDTLLTLYINGGNGPRIRDGVDQGTVPASRTFPYLAPPERNPPAVKFPAIE